MSLPLLQPDLIPAHHVVETQSTHGRDQHLLSTTHTLCEPQTATGGREPFCPPPIIDAIPIRNPAAGTFCPAPICLSKPNRVTVPGNLSGWYELRICVDLFDRAQAARIAADQIIKSGVVDAAIFKPHLDQLTSTEKIAQEMMVSCYERIVPPEILQWQKTSPYVGGPSLARLLGHLGDPYIATPHHWDGKGRARHLVADQSYVRTVSQLWQFAGHGAADRRRKGMSASAATRLGSPLVKKNLRLLAIWSLNPKGAYRPLYDAIRLKVHDRVDSAGIPWTEGHKNSHALRIVGKEILRDMWLARHHAESAAS